MTRWRVSLRNLARGCPERIAATVERETPSCRAISCWVTCLINNTCLLANNTWHCQRIISVYSRGTAIGRLRLLICQRDNVYGCQPEDGGRSARLCATTDK